MVEDRDVLTRTAPGPTRLWRYGTHPDQVADVYDPVGPGDPGLPIVLVHGGFWRPAYDRQHLRPMASALAGNGRRVLSLEYRRIPGSPDATLHDLTTALARLPVAGPVLIAGHSAGGHLALLLAGLPHLPIAGWVALAPVADLALAESLALDGGAVGDFLGTVASARPDLDPARGPGPLVPGSVLHGEQDTVVPITVSESYAASVGSDLVRIARCGHFALIDPATPAWRVVVDHLDRLARVAAKGGVEGRSGIE